MEVSITPLTDGWSLLLCHGRKHTQVGGLNQENVFTVDDDIKNDPDMLLDIYKFKCNRCAIFDRVYIMFCPIDPRDRINSFLSLIENMVMGAIKPGGILYTPDYLYPIKNFPSIPRTTYKDHNGDKRETMMMHLVKKYDLVYRPYDKNFPNPVHGRSLVKNILKAPGTTLNLIAFQYLKD
jgi:hypothetical protein